jgi:hypothetical protein
MKIPGKEKAFLGGAALLFFVLYLIFPFGAGTVFNSPDETASWFFIKRLAVNGDFAAWEPLNAWLGGAARPRSISWNGSVLVPQGFAGLPLFYGWLGRFFSLDIVKFITPFLSALGALSFYGLVKRIFGKPVAGVSFLLLLAFPVYWYYASRHLYGNVPFAALLLVAAWASFSLCKGGKNSWLIIFSLSLAAALAIRPAEILWVAPFVAFLIFIYRKEISWRRVFYSAAIGALLIIPFFEANAFFYGSPLRPGYLLSGAAGEGMALSSFLKLENFRRIFLPFGFSPPNIAQNGWIFLVKYFWWYSLPAVAGFLLWLFGKKTKEEKIYAVCAALSSAWLVFFYGSGKFSDNPSGNISFGDSHLRYWLPFFIFILPFAALFFIRIAGAVKQKKIVSAALAAFLFVMSAHAVWFSSEDGLSAVKESLRRGEEIKTGVLREVGPRDVIITGRQDKLFFPERKVIYAEKLTGAILKDIFYLGGRDFYYFSIGIGAQDLRGMNDVLQKYGYRLERVAIFGKEVLYKLKKTNEIVA